eukprot:m.236876 g.236876  ORF g.236876 m.236876 type:complete len:138 (+) comp15267_c0_seq2:3153-3566(+)
MCSVFFLCFSFFFVALCNVECSKTCYSLLALRFLLSRSMQTRALQDPVATSSTPIIGYTVKAHRRGEGEDAVFGVTLKHTNVQSGQTTQLGQKLTLLADTEELAEKWQEFLTCCARMEIPQEALDARDVSAAETSEA